MNKQLLGYIQKQHELEKLKQQFQQLKLMYQKAANR